MNENVWGAILVGIATIFIFLMIAVSYRDDVEAKQRQESFVQACNNRGWVVRHIDGMNQCVMGEQK